MSLPLTASFPQSGSIVSRWKLNEASGSRVDDVGANDLTDNNTVGSATGQFGELAADFEAGSSESLSIADASQSGLDITGDLSFAVWVKIESAPGTYSIMGKGTPVEDNYRFFYRNSSGLKLNADFWNGANETDATVAQNLGTATWHHVVIVFDVSVPKIEIYVDGATVSATTGVTNATSIANGSGVFYLGELAGALFFDGLMQDAIIWNTALSGAEVLSLYDEYFVPSITEVNLNRTPIRGVMRGVMRP